MSERERMYQLLDTVPDKQISYIIGYIQGLTANREETPNDETIDAIREGNEIVKSGTGHTDLYDRKDIIPFEKNCFFL